MFSRTPVSQVRMADQVRRARQLGVVHRIMAYAGGVTFGLASYMGWRWIMNIEFSATIDQYVVTTPSLQSAIQFGSLSLIIWLVLCVAATSALLYLYVRTQRYDRMIHEVASTDFKTEAYTHKFLLDTLRAETARARRYKRPFSMLVISMDKLDTMCGEGLQSAQDSMVQWLVRLCAMSLRNVDLVCRYGRYNLVAVLPEVGQQGARIAAERIRRAAQQDVDSGVTRCASTVSIGIAEVNEGVSTAEDILIAADVALYEARDSGGNQVCAYDENMETRYLIDSRRLESLVHDGGPDATKELAHVVDTMSGSHAGHSAEVTRLCLILGRHLALPKDQLTSLKMAALLRNIGQIALPQEGESGAGEENHTVSGARILADVPELAHLAPIVKAHHERFDGTGYPDRLRGAQIPLFARIIAIADTFAAITERLGLRGPVTPPSAMTELMKAKGTLLDPTLVTEFAEAIGSNITSTESAA